MDSPTRWTNPSVRRMADDRDPVEVLTQRARQVIREAMDAGWSGPPFDPIRLAEILNLPMVPRDDVQDARTVPAGKDSVRIEFNPNRPASRLRYSIAHEIGHTLFPDCKTLVRNRASYHELTGDDWQIEALCNIAAAEFLMPAGSIAPSVVGKITAEQLVSLQRQFQVSLEALVIRLAKSAEFPCAAFCASAIERGSHAGRYQLDYIIGSPTWKGRVRSGVTLPANSAVTECIAIGFTESGRERWPDGSMVAVECVGIPPYPGHLKPRVAGLVLGGERVAATEAVFREVRGDATEPRGAGVRIIAHIVNDATPNWGGGGFASYVRRKLPAVQDDFRAWASATRAGFKLGATHQTPIDQQRVVFHMVAQHGYGPSAKPRVRYTALDQCLKALGEYAASQGATVHMPRIGTGQAGGSWDVIRDMIGESVCARGVSVTVYTPPNKDLPQSQQPTLQFSPAVRSH